MAKKTSAVSDEEIIAALIESGTVKEAAAKTGITPRAIYERMANRDFKAAYSGAKSDIMRQAVFNMNAKLADAIEAVAEIMTDKEVNPATRLQAAQTILNNAGKFATRLTEDEMRTGEYTRNPLSFDF